MAAVYEHDGHTLEVETSQIEVTSYSPQPDPGWTFTDAAGHAHAALSSGPAYHGHVTYPSLVLRHGPATWCQDCQDEHMDAWWECRICSEKIIPGTRVPVGRQFIPGMTTYLLDNEPITPDEARVFVARWQRELNHRTDDHQEYRRD